MLTFSSNIIGVATIQHNVTEKDIESIMVGGIEGGIGYWAVLNNVGENWRDKPSDEPSSICSTKLLLEGKEVEYYDTEDEDDRWNLTLEKLINGYELNLKQRNWDSSIENGDASTCDCIIQYALFGKIVFG
jgi:hypothetical protein